MQSLLRCCVLVALPGALGWAQQPAQQQKLPPLPPPPVQFQRPPAQPPPLSPEQVQQQRAQTPQQQAPAQQQQPTTAPANAAAQPAPPAGPPTTYGGLTLNNASLVQVIDMLARQLHINYILDPRVRGGVILNTYGETKNIDTRSLLEAILRINGFGMVKQGDLYRIVPLSDIQHLPLPPETVTNPNDIPEDDRTMLNLVFLKYVTADELAKVLEQFIGENARMYTYAPANLLFILDSHRNMRRTMELVAMFDNDTLANKRVRLFEVKNGRPTDLVKELESIVKSISLSDKSAPIKFLPVDRINTIIAVAPNPGAFNEVETWLKKLDVPVKITAGAIDNYVYRVKYGNAALLACGIMQLYGGGGAAALACSFGYGGYGGGYGGFPGAGVGYGGGFGGGGFGSPYGGAYGAYGGGMMPGAYGGGMMPGAYGAGMMPGAYGGAGYSSILGLPPGGAPPNAAAPNAGATTPTGAPLSGQDLTGSYLGSGAYGYSGQRVPRIVPNPFNNTLMIQATPQEYEQILKLLRDMDLPPRQVLIDAKIYEVDLTGSFSSSINAVFQDKGTTPPGTTGVNASHHIFANLSGGFTNVTDGLMVGRAKELLGAVQLAESQTKAKLVSAPSVIATDSIPASINVGTEVPTLTAQAITPGVQQNGSNVFANTISNRNTGVTMNIVAQVNPSGIVTLIINQEVSAPIPPSAGGIQSPSFSKRVVQTQVTVQDGDTIAIGGIIEEDNSSTSTGLPGLHRLPVIGALFGTKAYSKSRTELIIFFTPRVIYDTNMIQDASEELKGYMRTLRKSLP